MLKSGQHSVSKSNQSFSMIMINDEWQGDRRERNWARLKIEPTCQHDCDIEIEWEGDELSNEG